jgi:hypothetical protein
MRLPCPIKLNPAARDGSHTPRSPVDAASDIYGRVSPASIIRQELKECRDSSGG